MSDTGQVYNPKTRTIRRPSVNNRGILCVSFNVGKHITTRALAPIVADLYVPNPFGPDINCSPIHLDGDRTNCAAENLMWRPRWFTVRYHRQFGYDSFYEKRNPFELVETGERFDTYEKPCIKFGLYWFDVVQSIMHAKPTPFTHHIFTRFAV